MGCCGENEACSSCCGTEESNEVFEVELSPSSVLDTAIKIIEEYRSCLNEGVDITSVIQMEDENRRLCEAIETIQQVAKWFEEMEEVVHEIR